MGEFGHINYSECRNNHFTTLRAHIQRRPVLFDDGYCMPGVFKNDFIIGIAVRRVVQLHRAQKHNQSANTKQPNGLDKNRNTSHPIHDSNQFSLPGHIQFGRGRISSHISAQNINHGYIHSVFA
jgi:hypothetical protein